MAHFRTTLEAKASPQAAFDYLADFSNCAEWDPSVARARRLTEKPIGKGSQFEVILELLGRPIRFVYEIERYGPSRLLTLVAERELVRSFDTIEIEPNGSSGCRVRYDADLRLHGLAYLFDLPTHLGFQISGARSVAGLARALDHLDSSR